MPEDAGSRDVRTDNIKEEVERGIPLFLLFYVFVFTCMHSVCALYASPTAYKAYGHAYSRFCMHCMQSFSELCSRIACIVGFLMHTTHTAFSIVHSGNEADRTDEMRTRPQERAMTVG